MTTPAQTEGMTLYYREGSHDKIYQAALQPQGDGFIVSFAFGRRGTTLQTGTKTPVPVAYAKAKKAFDNLVKSKLAKGYTPGETGTPYQHTDNQPRATGVLEEDEGEG
jgi:bifunctional non-homologous end joining protein LigD